MKIVNLAQRTFAVMLLALFAFALPAKADYKQASFYGGANDRQNAAMANGECFNADDPTIVANRTLPFGTVVRLTANGRSLIVTVKDRGPFVDKARREWDVTVAGAQQLGITGQGVAWVTSEILSTPPHNILGSCSKGSAPQVSSRRKR